MLDKFINNDDFADKSKEIMVLQTTLQFENQAKELAPVKTGRLKNSITHIKDGQDYLVGTSVSYGAHIEFGTKYIAPISFLRATAEILKGNIGSLEGLKNYLKSIESK